MDGLSPVTLNPSRLAFYLYVIAVFLAALSIVLSGLGALWKMLCVLLLAWSVMVRRVTIPAMIGYADRQWWVMDQGSDSRVVVELCGDMRVLAWLVVMWCRRSDNGKTVTLALWPDSAASDDLRRLRVFLRYGQWR